MKQLEMKHTMLILSSCSWSCCTLRKFIIRWLYPQCFPCSSLCYLSSFLPLKNKQQQQRKAYKGRSGGENASRNNFKYAEWLLPAAKKKKKKNQMLSFLHTAANLSCSIALFYHSIFPILYLLPIPRMYFASYFPYFPFPVMHMPSCKGSHT